MISLFDTRYTYTYIEASFSVSVQNTGMPGDGGQHTMDTICRKFDNPMYRIIRYDIQH